VGFGETHRAALAGFVHPIFISLHAEPPDARPRLDMGDQLTIGISHASTYFGHLRVGQPHLARVLDVIEQRSGCGILLRLGQSFDLAQRLSEQFGDGGNMALTGQQV
jgi:hypothetical protein